MKLVRVALLVVAIAAYCAAVLFARPHATPGPALRDFEAYYAAGATWRRHDDPYGRTIWNAERRVPGADAPREELLPFVNPPPMLPLLAPLARMPYALAAMLWTALLGIALLVLLAATLALGERSITATTALASVATALAFGPISSDFALGQYALFAVAGATVSAWSFARGSGFAGAVGAFIALLQPTLFAPVVAAVRSGGALAAVAAAIAGSALIWLGLFASLHAPSLVQYVALVRAHGAAERFALIQFTPAAIAYGFGASKAAAAVFGWTIAAIALLAWASVAVRRNAGVVQSFALGCVLLPLAVPFLHEHDLAIVFPAAVLIAMRHKDALMRATALVGTLFVAVDWLGLAQRPDGWIQTLLLALAVLAGMLALLGEARATVALACVPVLVLVVVLGAAVAHHPAPIWPDAMHVFAASTSTSAATVWHAEQAASGMFARDPLFAALRALPLLGCALLAIAMLGWRTARGGAEDRSADRGLRSFFDSAR